MKIRSCSLSLLLLSSLQEIDAFQLNVRSQNVQQQHNTGRLQPLYLIDPISLNIGIALASAAAGAVTQSPRIQELERELNMVKQVLSEVSTRSEIII
jgi:hypothetical protein